MKEIKTFSAEETMEIGRKLGSLLQGGELICLNGDLGTGKTAFTGGVAKALGIEGYITSPTFTLVNEYKGRLAMYHFDVYRIADPEEMFEIGFEEYLESNGVVLVEWADLIREILPEEYIGVDIRKALSEGVTVRVIHLEFKGERYKGMEEAFGGIASN